MNTDQPQKGLATTSLVLGILALFPLSILAGIPAIITGHIARSRARKSPLEYGGAGFALAGLVMGYLSLAITAIAITVLAGLLLPGLSEAKTRAQSIHCINNMKQIGLAFRIFATDHEDRFPFHVSTNQGGTLELCQPGADGYDQNVVAHFQALAKELATPKVLVCVGDSTKQVAASFDNLEAANISYLLRTGTNVTETNPQEILVRCPVHNTVCYCDGSVHQGVGQ